MASATMSTAMVDGEVELGVVVDLYVVGLLDGPAGLVEEVVDGHDPLGEGVVAGRGLFGHDVVTVHREGAGPAHGVEAEALGLDREPVGVRPPLLPPGPSLGELGDPGVVRRRDGRRIVPAGGEPGHQGDDGHD